MSNNEVTDKPEVMPIINSMSKLTNTIQEMGGRLINLFEKTFSTPKSNTTVKDKSTFFRIQHIL